jgi:hypothetical protein
MNQNQNPMNENSKSKHQNRIPMNQTETSMHHMLFYAPK